MPALEILLVEDSQEKSAEVAAAISACLPEEDYTLILAANVAEAVSKLRRYEVTLMILDLQVPMRAGEAPKADAGIRLLTVLERPGDCRVPEHIIGLTEYDELLAEHSPKFRERLLPLVKFSRSSDEWVRALSSRLALVAAARHGVAQSGFRTDIAIVTALHKVELQSVLQLPVKWSEHRPPGDDTIYHRASFGRGKNKLKVVAACASEMGMPTTSALAMKIIEVFRPRVIAMCGIAAGIDGAFGDILIADRCWDYGSGKLVENGAVSIFKPNPSQIPIHPWLKARMNLYLMDDKNIESVVQSWSGERPPSPLKARLGPVASGASVVSNRTVIDDIRQHNDKLIGIEMEAYGVFVAANSARRPRPMPLVIKSICDFGDKNKNDDYQRYAAHTSARFLYEFSVKELVALKSPEGF